MSFGDFCHESHCTTPERQMADTISPTVYSVFQYQLLTAYWVLQVGNYLLVILFYFMFMFSQKIL